MAKRTVRAAAGDGFKTGIAKHGVFGTKCEKFVCRHAFVNAAIGCGFFKPCEITNDFLAVAFVRLARSFKLDLVLAGLGQRHRITADPHRRTGIGKLHAQPVGCGCLVQTDRLIAQRTKGFFQFAGLADGRIVFKPFDGFSRKFAFIHKQINRCITIDDGISQRQRNMGHIAPPDIQKPCDAVRR